MIFIDYPKKLTLAAAEPKRALRSSSLTRSFTFFEATVVFRR
jgi:hypothetical protein